MALPDKAFNSWSSNDPLFRDDEGDLSFTMKTDSTFGLASPNSLAETRRISARSCSSTIPTRIERAGEGDNFGSAILTVSTQATISQAAGVSNLPSPLPLFWKEEKGNKGTGSPNPRHKELQKSGEGNRLQSQNHSAGKFSTDGAPVSHRVPESVRCPSLIHSGRRDTKIYFPPTLPVWLDDYERLQTTRKTEARVEHKRGHGRTNSKGGRHSHYHHHRSSHVSFMAWDSTTLMATSQNSSSFSMSSRRRSSHSKQWRQIERPLQLLQERARKVCIHALGKLEKDVGDSIGTHEKKVGGGLTKKLGR